jgi:hypothetical protein
MNDLNELFNLLAEEKRKKKAIEEKLKASIKEDLNGCFAQLGMSPSKEEIPVIVQEIIEDISAAEIPALINQKPAPEVPDPFKDVKKYLGNAKSTHIDPQPDPVAKEFKAVTEKIRLLEQSITKIVNTGPGSGEVNLRWLDDVDRSTIADNRYLRYNASTKKFIFDDVDSVGDFLTAINTTNQTFSPSVPTVIGINTQTTSRSISLVDGSKITFSKTGTYNIQYSLQAVNSDNAQWDMSIWVTKNGVNIADSNSIFTIPVRKTSSIYGKLIMTSPIPVDVVAGDYVQIMGHTEASLVSLSTIAEDSGNGIPRTPSVIVVVTKL